MHRTRLPIVSCRHVMDNCKIAEISFSCSPNPACSTLCNCCCNCACKNRMLSISFNEPCWYVSIPFFILIFIMLSRSIICSKFRTACQFQLFPFWMIQPNEIWTNPTNTPPMQKAKLATVQIQNDYRNYRHKTVQPSCTKDTTNEGKRI